MVELVTRAARCLIPGAWLLLGSCSTSEEIPAMPGASGTGGIAGTGGQAAAGRGGDGAGRSGDGAGRGGDGAGRGGDGAGRGGDAAGRGGGTAGSDAMTARPDCLHDGDGTTTLAFVNGCSASVTYAGSDIGGGTLASGAFTCVDIGSDVEALSSKRYWGFTGTDPGSGHYSLAEFTFNTDFNDFDWYNISFVDAFNLPLSIAPYARPDCMALTCSGDFLAGCPDAGKFEQGGEVVACVSPERDNGDSAVARYFEQCDDAYAWSGDDQNGDDPSPVRACAGDDWVITFCPEAGG